MYLYDNAILDKFRELFDTDKIFIVPPERAKMIRAQLDDDTIKFPLISLDRRGWTMLDDRNNWPTSVKGIPDSINNDGSANILHAIPIKIEYQLDVFTVDKVSCDEILRELIFYFKLHPTMRVHIPYGLETNHNFNVYFNPEVEDNSDTVEHINKGVLYRYTASFYTDDAYLFANTVVDIVTGDINGRITITEGNTQCI